MGLDGISNNPENENTQCVCANLGGPLPDSWSGMKNLEYLDLSRNQLNGTLPSSWGSSLTRLQNLDLFGNFFQGTLPPEWAQ